MIELIFIFFTLCLMALPFLLVLCLVGFRLIYQYERGMVFTLGRYQRIKEPGLRWILPIFQSLVKVDIRIKTVCDRQPRAGFCLNRKGKNC
jgi:regulator of protease activity HflC (stomatin/prohibitin superfamily)